MILQKNGVTYNLTDKTQIKAFINSGWKVVEKSDEKKSGNAGNKPDKKDKPDKPDKKDETANSSSQSDETVKPPETETENT